MLKRSRIADFLNSRREPDLSDNECINYDFDHPEAWEDSYWLHEKEDWPGLVRYYEAMISQDPFNPDAQFYLGDAYVLNGEYEKAIRFLKRNTRPPLVVENV